MDIWKILGIEKTNDKEQIKLAYRERLVTVNPEDDPKGFQVLRRAYEQALVEADKKEEKGDTWPDTPIGDFMRLVEDVYLHYWKRVDPASWEKLFSEDICFGLDTRNQVLEAMLVYFMSHFHLPLSVWSALEENFSIKEQREDLIEKFPPDYIDFVINNARFADGFEYTAFEEHDDNLSYDDYVEAYFSAVSALSRRETDEAAPFLEKMRDMGLTHPQGKVCYVRYLLQKDEVDEAKFEAEEILEEYEDRAYVRMMMAEINWVCEDYEESRRWNERVLEIEPNHFGAKCGIADSLVKAGQYKEAKKIYRELLMNNRFDDYVHSCMLECNVHLIDIYTNNINENSEDYESYVELIWCYYQNFKFDEALECLDKMKKPDNVYFIDYCYLKGRIYLQKGDRKKSLEGFFDWKDAYERFRDTEEYALIAERNEDRIGLVDYFIAENYCFLAEDEKNPLLLEQAIDYNKLAMEKSPKDSGIFLTQRGEIAFRQHLYEDAIFYELLAIEKEANNYEAMMIIGDSYGKLEEYQEALDYYQRVNSCCPYYVNAYIEQVKIFIQFDAYEQAQEIIDRFLETGVPSNRIKIYQAKLLLIKQKYDEAKKLLDEVEQGFSQDDAPKDVLEMDEFYHEKALFLYDDGAFEEAVKTIKKAIKEKPDEPRYYYLAGNFYWELAKHKEAIRAFSKAHKLDPTNTNTMFLLGSVYLDIQNYNKALAEFENVIRLEPNHPRVYGKMGMVYERCGKIQNAIDAYSKQLDIEPTGYYYVSRGILYMYYQKENIALAEEDFLRACELDHNHGFAYFDLGRLRMGQNLLPQAKEYYEKAIEVAGRDVSPEFYCYLAKVYSRMGKISEAIEILNTGCKKISEDRIILIDQMGYILANAGYRKDALTVYEGLEKNCPGENLYDITRTKIFNADQLTPSLLSSILKRCSKNLELEQAIRSMALVYLCKKNYKKAYKLLLDIENGDEDFMDEYYKGICCKNLGYEDILLYANTLFIRASKDTEDALGARYSYFWMAIAKLMKGENDQAWEFYNKMKQEYRCDNCIYGTCFEVFILESMLYEAEGDEERAAKSYLKAVSITPYAKSYFPWRLL